MREWMVASLNIGDTALNVHFAGSHEHVLPSLLHINLKSHKWITSILNHRKRRTSTHGSASDSSRMPSFNAGLSLMWTASRATRTMGVASKCMGVSDGVNIDDASVTVLRTCDSSPRMPTTAPEVKIRNSISRA